jgi:hypothetical protein
MNWSKESEYYIRDAIVVVAVIILMIWMLTRGG